MKLIELCQYTIQKSYEEEVALYNLNKEEDKKHG